MSNNLHVDVSLVSKWRTGKRKLTYDNQYIDTITDYFINTDRNTNKLPDLLKSIFKNCEITDDSTLRYYLLRYLTENRHTSYDNPTPLKNNFQTKFYEGEFGKRMGITCFFDYALSLPPGQEIYILLQDNLSWIYKNNNLLDIFNKNIIALLERKDRITFIRTPEITFKMMSQYFDKRLLYGFCDSYKGYFLPFTSFNGIKYCQFIIKNKFVFSSTSIDDLFTPEYSIVAYDKIHSRFYENLFMHYLKESQTLNKFINSDNIKEANQIFRHPSNAKAQTLMISQAPPLITFSDEFTEEILEANQFSKEQRHLMKNADSVFQKSLTSNSVIYFHESFLDFFEATEKGFYPYHSMLTGKPVFLDKDHVIKSLENLVKLCEMESIKLFIIDSSIEKFTQIPMIMIKRGIYVMFGINMSFDKPNKAIVYTDPFSVNSIFTFIYQDILSCTIDSKNLDWLKSKLNGYKHL